MIRCLDIHTHHEAPQPLAVISATPDTFSPVEGQLYSLGIHPWETNSMPNKEDWRKFEELASLPCVVAIGECGIDKLKGGFMFQQLIVMQKQIEISERLKKPLIIHDVKAHDVIVGLKRDLNPVQNWAIHGLRGKPTVAKMMVDAGIYVSFGDNFNPKSPAVVPSELILAETDESSLDIQTVIALLSANLEKEMTPQIALNTARFLNFALDF